MSNSQAHASEGSPDSNGDGEAATGRGDFFGHPRGLATLFFTELWERFSYYGLRAMLVLFMTAHVTRSELLPTADQVTEALPVDFFTSFELETWAVSADVYFWTADVVSKNPGLGFTTAKATAVYGLYTSLVYLLALPGGWVADNIWGQRRAVFVGGCIISAGHFSLAMPILGLPEVPFFYLGLILIVVGTGLLKPNISTMVGDLYPEGGARRDAGFSVFYMGINFGAILGPTLCGWLGEGYDWHIGFSLAGFGMLAGLASYIVGLPNLGDVGLLDADDEEAVRRKSRNFYIAVGATAAALVTFGFLATSGAVAVTLSDVANVLGIGILLVTLLFFAYLTLEVSGAVAIAGLFTVATLGFWFFVGSLNDAAQYAVGLTVVAFLLVNVVRLAFPNFEVPLEKRRFLVIFWLFLLAALFWSGFEQAGSSLNLFAKEHTARTFGPYMWLQDTTPFLPAILLAIPGLYVLYRILSREDLWWVGKAGTGVLVALVVGFAAYVFYQMASGWTMPASMLQNINPTFIVLFAPVFGAVWTWLAHYDANPSIPVKFALGLFGLAAGFLVIAWGALRAQANPVGPHWLIVTYFLHTCGELCLSPIGLSSMTKLAPEDRVGQMMGVWFVSGALGNLVAGLIAGQLESLSEASLFGYVALIVGGAGLVALLLAIPVKWVMGDIE